ncbi:DUF456 domain-containing protein [Streptomyces triticagri]|uniref:DUF456 domain-containing protein n=1 Tax=Streptomyces triticagri TaxID=2293568 RepID=A0A372M2Z4_9ACTN|nr:DUF456 domain-containing protein [Streptomyces triticagri]RFU85010.1 DUF456 domain-containing protein [Streptomyces triticagri]
MNAWELALVAVVLLLGVCGVLLPGVPGPWLVWAAVLWWSLTTQSGVAWAVLVGVTALLLVSQVVRWLLPARRLREAGMTRTMALWAGGGAFLGFCVLPVIGAIPGFVGGIYASERIRLGRHASAKSATRTAMREAGTSILVELFGCLLAAGAWLGAVIWGR